MNFGFRFTTALIAMTGLITGLAFFGWTSVQTVKHQDEDMLKERLTLAYTAAYYLDNNLRAVSALLDTAVDNQRGIPSLEQFVSAERLIRRAFAEYGVEPLDIAVVDEAGSNIIDIPETPEMMGGVGYQAFAYPAVRKALQDQTYTISDVVYDPLTDMPAVLFISPIWNTDRTLAGALVAEISIAELHLFFLTSTDLPGLSSALDGRTGSLGKTGYVEIVDGRGVFIDRTVPGPPVQKNEQSPLSPDFLRLITENRAATMKYIETNQIIAFAPLSIVPWGVSIRQAEAEFFDATTDLERQLIIYGVIFVLVSLVIIRVGMQRILQPILMLTAATQRVGAGDFDVSIPVKSHDEIGELADSFRTMTGRLKESRNTLSRLYEAEREKEELRGRLLENTVTAQEEERKRIARELHDDLAQRVTALLIRLDGLEKCPGVAIEPLRGELDGAKKLAADVLNSIRDITFMLRPMDLDLLGLTPALRSLAEARASSTLNVEFQFSGTDERLPPTHETAVYRIAQELLHNIEKHAAATNVNIELVQSADAIELTVEDNGIGFDVDGVGRDPDKTKSFGLIGIRERVGLLGGLTLIDSQQGKGTRVKVTVPLADTEANKTKGDGNGQDQGTHRR